MKPDNMKKTYPDALGAIQGALALEHDPAEVEAVRWVLSLPQRLRTTNNLLLLGRRFAKRFVAKPVKIYHVPDGATYFNHTKRYVQLGKPELAPLLHEIGHAKYGPSEETAVAYSLGLLLKADQSFVPILRGHILENDPY